MPGDVDTCTTLLSLESCTCAFCAWQVSAAKLSSRRLLGAVVVIVLLGTAVLLLQGPLCSGGCCCWLGASMLLELLRSARRNLQASICLSGVCRSGSRVLRALQRLVQNATHNTHLEKRGSCDVALNFTLTVQRPMPSGLAAAASS